MALSASAKRATLWGLAGIVLAAGLVMAFTPRATPVDLAAVVREPLVVTIDEEGETRIRDVFRLSAPVTGRVRRIEAEVGDVVVAGETVVAEIEPIDPTFLDQRSEAQAEAALEIAQSNLALAASQLEEAEAEFEFAEAEVARARVLIGSHTISRQALDDAERRYKATRAALATARAQQQVRESELVRARAHLLSPVDTHGQHGSCECVPLTAPVDGRILQVLRESEGVVQAGTVLVEIGDPRDLEIVVDFLSSDAVNIEPGQRVIIHDWGGDNDLEGRVSRVEPFGFTKVSALGIEEQRVNSVIDFTSPATEWTRLGHGYRVETRVVVWEARDVVQVPLTALFRDGDLWAVFIGAAGRAYLRHVSVGHTDGLSMEITRGLEVGQHVIVAPNDRIADGVRVVRRERYD